MMEDFPNSQRVPLFMEMQSWLEMKNVIKENSHAYPGMDAIVKVMKSPDGNALSLN